VPKRDVVEAGGMFQQVDEPHRRAVRPAVVEIERRQEIGDFGAQRHRTVLDQHHRRDRGEALSDRTGAEHGRVVDRSPGPATGQYDEAAAKCLHRAGPEK
jgi:hypothetical protein